MERSRSRHICSPTFSIIAFLILHFLVLNFLSDIFRCCIFDPAFCFCILLLLCFLVLCLLLLSNNFVAASISRRFYQVMCIMHSGCGTKCVRKLWKITIFVHFLFDQVIFVHTSWNIFRQVRGKLLFISDQNCNQNCSYALRHGKSYYQVESTITVAFCMDHTL